MTTTDGNTLTGAQALKLVAAERAAAVIAADASWKKTQAMMNKRDTSTWDAERENELRFDTWRKDAAANALRTLELKLIDAA
jgi:hypothetical protein